MRPRVGSIQEPLWSLTSWSASQRRASVLRGNDFSAMTRCSKNTFARQVTLPEGNARRVTDISVGAAARAPDPPTSPE